MQKIWPFSVNFLLFSGVAFALPYLVLFYQSLGLSGTEIGILVGLLPFITLFGAPLWTTLADATQLHRVLMWLSMSVTGITIFILPFFHDIAPVIVVIILLNIFSAPISSFLDSATMHMLGDRKEMYGRIRVGGTIGFAFCATIAGYLIRDYGLRIAFWGGGALYFLGAIVSLKLSYNPIRGSVSPWSGMWILLKQRRWIIFLTLAFTGGLAMAAINNYLFSYMKELGAREDVMGFALTVGTFSEIPILIVGNWLLKRLKPYGLLVLTSVITGIRVLAYAFSSSPEMVLAVQLLNGLTFSAMWMAGVSYADEHAPAGMSATVQGIFGAVVFGFGPAVGGFAGGLLLERMGGRGMYLVFGIAILVIAALASLLQNRSRLEQPVAAVQIPSEELNL